MGIINIYVCILYLINVYVIFVYVVRCMIRLYSKCKCVMVIPDLPCGETPSGKHFLHWLPVARRRCTGFCWWMLRISYTLQQIVRSLFGNKLNNNCDRYLQTIHYFKSCDCPFVSQDIFYSHCFTIPRYFKLGGYLSD